MTASVGQSPRDEGSPPALRICGRRLKLPIRRLRQPCTQKQHTLRSRLPAAVIILASQTGHFPYHTVPTPTSCSATNQHAALVQRGSPVAIALPEHPLDRPIFSQRGMAVMGRFVLAGSLKQSGCWVSDGVNVRMYRRDTVLDTQRTTTLQPTSFGQSSKPARCSRLSALAMGAACSHMLHPGRLLCPAIVFTEAHRQGRQRCFSAAQRQISVSRENNMLAGCSARGVFTVCYTRHPVHASADTTTPLSRPPCPPPFPRMSP